MSEELGNDAAFRVVLAYLLAVANRQAESLDGLHAAMVQTVNADASTAASNSAAGLYLAQATQTLDQIFSAADGWHRKLRAGTE